MEEKQSKEWIKMMEKLMNDVCEIAEDLEKELDEIAKLADECLNELIEKYPEYFLES